MDGSTGCSNERREKMASKRINVVPLTIEELEYLIGVPTGHHVENVTYNPNRRVIHIHLSGDSMSEVPAGHEIPWVRLNELVQRWREHRRKHTEPPIGIG